MEEILKFKGKYKFLSNSDHSIIEYNGIVYPTAEHAFQSAKMENEKDRNKIAVCASPKMAQRMASRLPVRKDWESVKDDVMHEILKIKFSQPEYRWLLVNTDDANIENVSEDDKYWGTVDGEGENRLGKILMKIREELQNSEQ